MESDSNAKTPMLGVPGEGPVVRPMGHGGNGVQTTVRLNQTTLDEPVGVS